MIRALLIGLGVILLVVAGGGWIGLRMSLPPEASEMSVPGLAAPAQLRYDPWQRPFVEAENLSDALAIQGWLHASHRLWQMELFRRAGQGRMAELLGESLLSTDKELWRAGVPQLARKLEANAGTETLALVDSYLQGVNEGIAAYRLAPPEFILLGADLPRWHRRDVFALGALMAFQSANNADNELLRLALASKLDQAHMAAFLTDDSGAGGYPFVLPPAASADKLAAVLDRRSLTDPAFNPLMPRLGFGSNGWVVGSDRSASGAPLFAFDSHDELGVPNLFYEVHLFWASGRQLRGWSVPGLPGVINGFNENIAWGFTNIGDTQDLFVETRSSSDPLQFKWGDEWYHARVETIEIPVKGQAPAQLEIVHTRHGPLISDTPPVSLAWTVHRTPEPSLDSMLAFNLAGDWSSFTAALDAFPAPTLNATYADVHGTIGFRTGGVLPLRGAGQGLVPRDGANPANAWRGLVPAAENPERTNPPSGFLAAANARVNAGGDGPLVSADNAAPYRIARIQQVLSEDKAFSPQDMQQLQVDWFDGQAASLLPAMLKEVGTIRGDASTETAVALLKEWGTAPVAARDSAAALIFQQWYLALAREVFGDRLDKLYPRLERRAYLLNHALDHLLLQDADSPWWRDQRKEILAEALRSALQSIASEQGDDPATWRLDRQQHVAMQHELGKAVPELSWLFDAENRPWGGSTATVGRARYSYTTPYRVNAAATVRVIAEMTPVPSVAAVIPGGQSGHPLSDHYLDQYPAWLAGELLPLAAEPGAVNTATIQFLPAEGGARHAADN